jgi:hypothetical protein
MRRLTVLRACVLFCLLSLLLFLSACTSTPEITKIGLIAPFEGLYRATGYASLEAMRAALDDAGATELAILPLAQDDGDDPQQAQRTARKLLADPAVVAVVGPLTPWAAAGAVEELASAPLWHTPFALMPDAGFVDPAATTEWADAWLAATAQAIRLQDATRLVLAGWTPGWPERNAAEWTDVAQMPVLLSDDPAAIEPGDAVLWLGPAAEGATYYNSLRRTHESAPLWLTPQGANSVFAAHANSPSNVYWTIWAPVEYNAEHAPNIPASPEAQLIYLATRQALQHLTSDSSLPEVTWHLLTFALLSDGESVLAQAD